MPRIPLEGVPLTTRKVAQQGNHLIRVTVQTNRTSKQGRTSIKYDHVVSRHFTGKQFNCRYPHGIFADAASEPEASEQVSSSNSYWDLKVRFYIRFFDQNAFC